MNFRKGVSAQAQPAGQKRKIVKQHGSELKYVSKGCALMELARSSFYYQPNESVPTMVKADLDILDRIEAIYTDFHGYGYRRVTRQLH
jgi:hypothetical protein